MQITSKVRIATVLSFIAVLAIAWRHADTAMMFTSIGTAFLISVPLVLLIRRNIDRLNKIATKGVVLLSGAIGAVVVRWLHSSSLRGELTFGFIVSFVLLAMSFATSKKELEYNFGSWASSADTDAHSTKVARKELDELIEQRKGQDTCLWYYTGSDAEYHYLRFYGPSETKDYRIRKEELQLDTLLPPNSRQKDWHVMPWGSLYN
mgnify:CR=1 FL=1